MKTNWESGGIAPRILNSALDGGEWSASRPGRFTLRARASATHSIGGWVVNKLWSYKSCTFEGNFRKKLS